MRTANIMTSFQRVYHSLDIPINPTPYTSPENHTWSALHNLYPGRPYDARDDFTPYTEFSPVSEDPAGARETFLQHRANTRQYAENLQKLALRSSGGDNGKVLVHAIDDPSSVIEDPDLRQAAIQQPPVQNDNFPFSGSPIVGAKPGAGVVGVGHGSKVEDRGPVGFQGEGRENFEGVGEDVKEDTQSGSGSENGSNSGSGITFTNAAIGLLIVLVIAILVGVYTGKSKK